MTATIFDFFPELKPRAKAIVAEAQTNYSIQEQKVKNLPDYVHASDRG